MERCANPPPDFLGLAKYLGISRKTLWEWIRDKEDYRNIIKGFGAEIYSNVLQENAIMGNYSQPFAIFAAKNRLGWKDKTELSGDQENPLSMKITGFENALKKIYE
jgi:DNA-binding Lrp family transcriptional regulator